MLALVLMFALAACGSTNNEETEGETEEETYLPDQLVIATGGTTGVYYSLGGLCVSKDAKMENDSSRR